MTDDHDAENITEEDARNRFYYCKAVQLRTLGRIATALEKIHKDLGRIDNAVRVAHDVGENDVAM